MEHRTFKQTLAHEYLLFLVLIPFSAIASYLMYYSSDEPYRSQREFLFNKASKYYDVGRTFADFEGRTAGIEQRMKMYSLLRNEKSFHERLWQSLRESDKNRIDLTTFTKALNDTGYQRKIFYYLRATHNLGDYANFQKNLAMVSTVPSVAMGNRLDKELLNDLKTLPEYRGRTDSEIETDFYSLIDDAEGLNALAKAAKHLPAYRGWTHDEIRADLSKFFPQNGNREIPQPKNLGLHQLSEIAYSVSVYDAQRSPADDTTWEKKLSLPPTFDAFQEMYWASSSTKIKKYWSHLISGYPSTIFSSILLYVFITLVRSVFWALTVIGWRKRG